MCQKWALAYLDLWTNGRRVRVSLWGLLGHYRLFGRSEKPVSTLLRPKWR
jgi:hypothetical protein